MFAVGPPRSLIIPLNEFLFVSFELLLRQNLLNVTELFFPDAEFRAQNVQPPKQPLFILMEFCIISRAGDFFLI